MRRRCLPRWGSIAHGEGSVIRLITSGLLLLALLAMPLRAGVPEAPRVRIIGVAQGMPSSDVKAIAKDAAGYIWIGTVDGLARHDGVDVQVWRHDPADANSLPGNHVQQLHIDAQDRIWMAIEGSGLAWLDAQRERVHRVDVVGFDALAEDDVWALAGDADGLWFGTFGNGLYRLTWPQQDAPTHITHVASAQDGSLPSNTVLGLAVDTDGAVWIATASGIARHVPGQDTQPVALPGEPPAPITYSVTVLSDGLWVGTAQGVFHRPVDGSWRQPAWTPMFERPNAMSGIARDLDGSYWITSQRGLWRTHGEAAPVPVPLGGPNIPRYIHAMLLEPSGALWVPVFGAGLGYLRSDWRRLAQFTQQPNGLRGEMYQAVTPAAQGGVWLAGYNGEVERIDRAGDVHALPGALRDSLLGTRFTAIEQDAQGALWLGHQRGLMRVGADGQVRQWQSDSGSNATLGGSIIQLQADQTGGLWLAANGAGVQRRDIGNGDVLQDYPAGDAHGLGLADIEVLRLDAHGQPWLGASTGVLRLSPDYTRFEAVTELGSERVHALGFNAAGDLWVQRMSGLVRYQHGAQGWQEVERVGTEEGLPALAAAGLVVDARQRVWLSSTRGLYVWKPESRLLQRYGVQDGLASQEFLNRALSLADDGMLVAAAVDGSVVLVDTEMPALAAIEPVLRIDGAWARRQGNWEPISHDGLIRLAPGERELRVRSRLLAFDDPSANRYWTMLEGHESEWVPQFGGGQRVYSGLTPGNYLMRVRASDAAGNLAHEQTIPVIVQPPWWSTWWLRSLLLASALASLALIGREYRARLKRRHEWQLAEQQRNMAEQASHAKTRFLATLGHEVRTPMTGVLGMSELLLDSELNLRQRSQVMSIRHAGEHLLRLVNDALDLARVEAGKLQLQQQPFDVHAMFHGIVDGAAPLADRRGLQFADALHPDTPRWLLGDCTRVEQILLNLLGNAIKFTDHGHVMLSIAPLAPHGLCCSVSDTGPGLNEEQKQRLFRRFEQAEGARTAARYGGSGLGLAICQELAAQMDGRIRVDSTPGQGTTFHVELPLPLAEAPAPSPETTSPAPSRGLRLLLVEDDATVAEVLTGLLQAQGHHVTHAAHGLEALTTVAGNAFDMALLDLDLPGMDGLALARTLRAQGFHAPLMAVTARADAQAEPQAMAAGFDAFIRKPLTSAMLADAVEDLALAKAKLNGDAAQGGSAN